jgi:hypothetical protein
LSIAHISGYATFAEKSIGNCVLFYTLNLPWLATDVWLGWDAYRAMVRGQRR